MNRFLRSSLCVVVVALMACGKPPVNNLIPIFKGTPLAVTFSACPRVDSAGNAVRDVFPDVQKIKIVNEGRSPGALDLKFQPANGPFSIALDGGLPASLDALAEIEIPIAFSPTMSGSTNASLLIDDGNDKTDAITPITLSGDGINRPAQPTVLTRPQNKAGADGTCVQGATVDECTAEFPDTLFGENSTRTIKIKNTGCPALKITELALEPRFPGDALDFAIVSPSQLPSTTNPIVLSPADGNEELVVTIKFAPADDGSGNTGRDALLRIKSNDPASGDGMNEPSLLSIRGEGIKPALSVSPGYCDFSQALDTCGNAMKITDKATFKVRNDGNAAITLDPTTFESPAGTRFSFTTPITGTMMPGEVKTLEVTHTPAADGLYVSNAILFSASFGGMAPGSGGRVRIPIYGGLKPCLTTDPDNTLAYENPTSDTTAKTVTIRNGATCGTLILNSVSIDMQGSQFFSLLDPRVMNGTRLAAGGSTEATVQYKRPVSGGTQIGTLRIKSNDSTFEGVDKQITLQGNSALDEVPTATPTACTEAELATDANCLLGTLSGSTRTVQLSRLMADAMGKKWMVLSCAKSTDAVPGMPGQTRAVKDCKFTLIPPIPSGSTTQNLVNNAMYQTAVTTKLELTSVGQYRVQLLVRDDRNQVSVNNATIIIDVRQ